VTIGSGRLGRPLGPHKDRKKTNHAVDESVHEGTIHTLMFDNSNFDTERVKHDIVIVNFFTPWCHWCQMLEPVRPVPPPASARRPDPRRARHSCIHPAFPAAPHLTHTRAQVWEKSAASVVEKYPGEARLRLAKVDCTADKSEALCTRFKIDAFPTIMVFRKEDAAEASHEKYHGERTVDAITAWADELMKQIKKETVRSKVVDYNNDGEKDSHNGVGCLVAGMLHVQKAPGAIVTQAVSEGHEFNWATMDVSHTVNHLSFGPFLSETAWIVLPPEIAQSVGSLDDKKFSSEEKVPTTHEHNVKVVKNLVEMPHSWGIAPIEAHGYVVHSNNIQRFAEVPSVRINYDILPIIVHVKASHETFYHFVTQLCAIVGGVFTVAGIAAHSLDATLLGLAGK